MRYFFYLYKFMLYEASNGDLCLTIKWNIYFKLSSFAPIIKEYIFVTSKKVRRSIKSLSHLPLLHWSFAFSPYQTVAFPSTSSSTFLHVFHVPHIYINRIHHLFLQLHHSVIICLFFQYFPFNIIHYSTA